MDSTLVLYNLPKLGLFCTNFVKTALFYSILTIYIGLRPKISYIFGQVNIIFFCENTYLMSFLMYRIIKKFWRLFIVLIYKIWPKSLTNFKPPKKKLYSRTDTSVEVLLDDIYLCLSDWTDAILFQTIYYFGAKKRGNNQVVETLQKRFLDRKSTLLTRWHCTANAYARFLHNYNSFKKIYKLAFEFGFLVYKGQIKSECIYEVIDFPNCQLKNLKDFCPKSFEVKYL